MSESISPANLDEAVELAEQQAGNTTRTLVPIPEQVSSAWELKYDEYVRVTLVTDGEVPKLALAPMGDLKYRHRNNDLKLTSNDSVALPRRIVRAFGLAGDVWWTEFDNQLVGTLTEYSDAQTLFKVAEYYSSQSVPGHEAQRATFDDLRDVANNEYQYHEQEPHGITTHRGAVRHSVPDDIGLHEDDELVFLLFHDGTEFIVGLIPHEEGEDEGEIFFKHQYNPMSASPGSHLETLPSVLLDYEKDKVLFHRNRSDQLYYTVPKQAASCLWLDDGYCTDWLSVGDAYFAQLIPKDRDRTIERANPTVVPQD